MKNFKKYSALSFLLSIQIFASGGSLYSKFGIGDFYYSFTARRLALGELGIATTDYDHLNLLNPASWSKIRLTRFETGMIYHGTNISSNSSSVFHSQTVFSGLMIGFPIDYQNGISFVGGIVPYSNVDYELALNEKNDLVDPHKLTYKGEGGINKAFIGLSYQLPFEFSLGASFEYYTGKIEHSSSIEFDLISSFRNAAFIRDYNYQGLGYSLGVISSNLSSIIGLSDLKDLRLGFSYTSGTNLNTDTVNNSSTLIGLLATSTGSYKTKLPNRIGFGLSLKWTDNYLFLVDYLYQPFSQFNSDNKTQNILRDLNKISLGFEYRNTDFRSQTMWEHISLRGGLSFEQTQYTINGMGINQISAYAGFSVPLEFDNTIDFGFQIGKRGTSDNNLLKENIYKFSITLSIGELWFIRQDR